MIEIRMLDIFKKILYLGIGGFIGSNSRFWLSLFVTNFLGGRFPAATLFVNAIGCFFLGILNGWANNFNISPNLRLFLGTGFIAALTTFSTFSLETLELFQKSSYGIAFLNLFLNIVIGFSAALLGLFLTKPSF